MKQILVIDTNLLVLLVVGSVRIDLIGKHRRTKGYGVDDFELLRELLGSEPNLYLLPNVVTETSNLIFDYRNPDRRLLLGQLRDLVDRCSERYVSSQLACSITEFVRLGVTDAALLAEDVERRTIYTDDLDFYLAAEKRNISCLYFTHERAARGLL